MKFVKTISVIVLLTLLGSCIKDQLPENPIIPSALTMEELIIPKNFDWTSYRGVDISLSVVGAKAYNPRNRVFVYQNDPVLGGELLISGSLTSDKDYHGRISLPSYQTSVYLRCKGAFGSDEIVKKEITDGRVNYTFDQSGKSEYPNKGLTLLKNAVSGPDCNTGCDQNISGGGNVNINGGQTYCISDSFDGNITFQAWNGGGTLRICGAADINNNVLSLGENCHIIVAENGSLDAKVIDMGPNSSFSAYESSTVTLTKFNAWSSTSQILNYGTITLSQDSYHAGAIENNGQISYSKKMSLNNNSVVNFGTISVHKTFTSSGNYASILNNGTMDFNDKFKFNDQSSLVNNGDIDVNKEMELNSYSQIENNGGLVIGDKMKMNNHAHFENNCSVDIEKKMEVNGSVILILNTGYIKVNEEVKLYSNQDVEMHDASMIHCQDWTGGGSVLGTGDLNSIIVDNDFDTWGNNHLDGAIELATSDGTIHSGNNSNFINGAYFTSIDETLNYLPVTACNPEGIGTPTVVDTDYDGVPDDLDDYPNDPDRAFNNYFPAEGLEQTIMFEDLWPALGDFDFNDLVIGVYGNEITNADDELVDIHASFIVKAVGASLKNGFGFQLDNITPDQIESVSGMVLEQGYISLNANGTEAGQSKAVIIVTESTEDVIHRAGGSMFNTIETNPIGTSDTTSLIIHMSNPVSRDLVADDGYNPFIIKNMDRNIEIHLVNNKPTDLMDASLLGSGQDVSDPAQGIYFVTESGLPWGLKVLYSIEYPKEKSQIIEAYTYFSTWAESGGMQHGDWYTNMPGYRNQNNIFMGSSK